LKSQDPNPKSQVSTNGFSPHELANGAALDEVNKSQIPNHKLSSNSCDLFFVICNFSLANPAPKNP
jgi:hypothetical protein